MKNVSQSLYYIILTKDWGYVTSTLKKMLKYQIFSGFPGQRRPISFIRECSSPGFHVPNQTVPGL
jgi:hypothetical protein